MGASPHASGWRAFLLPSAIVAAALVVRAWRFEVAGLDHFDEGIYALSARALGGYGAGMFPQQILFSPPLYFGIVGLMHRVLGVAIDVAAVGLNVFAGTMTVALVGWLGSRWFSRAAGWSAAALLALCEYHIDLSRAGLTDVLFGLLFTIALAAVVAALRSDSLRHALLAGLAVGLAWNTKYHGWLAVAIGALATVPGLVRERSLARWRRTILVLGAIALVAGACYLPWALYVQSRPGGYAALASYQRGMLRPGWLENLVTQARFQLLLDGPLWKASLPLALGVAFVVDGRGGRSRGVVLALLCAAAAWILGAPLLTVVLAAFGAVVIAQRKPDLHGMTLLAWLLVWLVLTPLYRPYARLVLPAMIAACLAAGVAVSALARRAAVGGWAGPIATVVGAAALLLPSRGSVPTGDPWRRSDGLRRAAIEIAPGIPAAARIYVLGEPALAYYLSTLGRDAVADVSGRDLPQVLEEAVEPAWVITGRYARLTGAEKLLSERLGPRVGAPTSVPFVPKDQRLLDDEPAAAPAYRADPDSRYELIVRRVAPRG